MQRRTVMSVWVTVSPVTGTEHTNDQAVRNKAPVGSVTGVTDEAVRHCFDMDARRGQFVSSRLQPTIMEGVGARRMLSRPDVCSTSKR